jgi:nitrite transporter NirC
MFVDTIEYFANVAYAKVAAPKQNPFGFFIGSMMAGSYLGFGIILIFIACTTAEPAYQKLVMGMSFCIALTLVVFGGCELFTGHTMYMPLG